LSFRGAAYSGVFTLYPLITGLGRAHQGEILAAAAKLVDQGKLMPLASGEHVNAFTIRHAHSLVISGSSGKVVVEFKKPRSLPLRWKRPDCHS
jgi:NADPH2:quinone reductase